MQTVTNDIIVRFIANKDKSFDLVQKQITDRMQGTRREIETLTTRNGKLVQQNKRVVTGYQRFHMELLSVMFAGMALSRAMGGLLQSSRQMVGVNEMLATTLGVTFLPAAIEQLKWTISLNQWLNNTKDPLANFARGFLNLAVPVAEAGGQIVMWFGQLGLATQGFKMLKDNMGWMKEAFGVRHILQFARDGWDKIGDAFSTLSDWGLKSVSEIKKTITATFSSSGWSEAGGVKGALDKLNKSEVIKIAVFITASLVAFEIGKEIGTRLKGTHIFEELIKAFSPILTPFMDINKGTEKSWWEAFSGGHQGFVMPFQSGGIVTKPTLGLIGESGPEAVIPLNNSGGMMSFSPTINITAGSNLDIETMKSQLTDQWYNELKSRGMR